jgi:hypothetical protein
MAKRFAAVWTRTANYRSKPLEGVVEGLRLGALLGATLIVNLAKFKTFVTWPGLFHGTRSATGGTPRPEPAARRGAIRICCLAGLAKSPDGETPTTARE